MFNRVWSSEGSNDKVGNMNSFSGFGFHEFGEITKLCLFFTSRLGIGQKESGTNGSGQKEPGVSYWLQVIPAKLTSW